MKILIVGNFLFPFGSAAASRIRHFAVGLTELGAEVRVISQVALYDRPEDLMPDGKRYYNNIPYESAVGFRSKYKEKRKPFERFLWFRDFIRGADKAAVLAEDVVKNDNYDVILQYNRSYYSLRPFIKLCKKYNIPLIQDVVEWPTRQFFTGGVLHPFFIDTKLAMHVSLPQSDGVIGISQFLVDFYSGKNIPSIRIPSVIHVPDILPEKENRDGKDFNITYLGSFTNRDSSFEIVEALKLLSAKRKNFIFTIIGSSGAAGDAAKARKICQNDPVLRDKVVFLGHVSDQEVKRRLCEADVLLFMRKDDISAKAAFPTRLPEYLITAIPVIIAGVGDIPLYLQDRKDAIVVSPATKENIATGIEAIMTMPDRGRNIGQSGFEKAKEYFNYKTSTKEIFDFMTKICQNRKPKID